MILASDLPPNTEVVQLTGPLVLGYLLHWGLFGTLTVQLYLYYEAFPVDKLAYKLLVYGVYSAELVQTILATQDAFDIFGYGFGDLKSAIGLHHEWFIVPIMSGLVALVGQTFYAYRILMLSKSWKISVLIVVVSLVGAITGVITGAFCVINGDLPHNTDVRLVAAIIIWCSASALSDIIIAVCMTYYLVKYDTGFRRTHAVVSKFIRLTIETGTVTALTALVGLIVFLTFPNRMYYQAASLITAKVYANAIMVVLNARFQIMHGRTTHASSDHTGFNTVPTPVFRDNGGTLSNSAYQPNAERTIVTIKQDVFSDHTFDQPVEMKTQAFS